MKNAKFLGRIKGKTRKKLPSFNVCVLRDRTFSYPLIFYMNVDRKFLRSLYIIRYLSVAYAYKTVLLDRRQSSIFISDTFFFKFLTNGNSFLIYFTSWAEFFTLLQVDVFSLHFNKLKIRSASWHGYFLNVKESPNTKGFVDKLVNFAELIHNHVIEFIGLLLSVLYSLVYVLLHYLNLLISVLNVASLKLLN